MLDYGNLDAKGRVELFDKTHDVSNAVIGGTRILYADGAIREKGVLGALIEPPTDPYKRCGLIVKYHEIKLQLAVEEFNQTKRMFVLPAQAALNERDCPPPHVDEQEAVAQLKQLKAKVEACQIRLNQARVELEQNTPAGLRQRQIFNQENRQRNSQLLSEIEKIEV